MLAELVERDPEESDAAAVDADPARPRRAAAGEHDDVEAIGVGAAGHRRVAGRADRLGANNAYRDWPVREQLEKATGLPVVVDNDANVAALAEARLGERRTGTWC